jgi:thiol:disulfide interchange protein
VKRRALGSQAVFAACLAALFANACARRDEPGAESGEPSASLSEKSSSVSLPFSSLTFDEALAKARAENKLVLVDVYTDWCGYCTKMDRDVFTNDRVKTALSDMIPIRVNAEKGSGRSLAARWGVSGLPTFLLVNAEGVVVHRFEGYLPAEVFLRQLGRAGARG